MYFSAFIYGLITLTSMWSAAAAAPEALATRTPTQLLVYALACGLLHKFYKIEDSDIVPQNKIFSTKATSIGVFGVTAAGLFLVSSAFPETYLRQSDALNALGIFSGLCFVLTLTSSFYLYKNYFASIWGFASAAFLEALTWGLALNSFLIFCIFFLSSYALFKFVKKDDWLWPSLCRALIGILWILFL